MTNKKQKISPAAATFVALLALASAMGIGRFSLTPIMPLMQQDADLSLALAGWMATANYLGYLIGALVCIALTPRPWPAVDALLAARRAEMDQDEYETAPDPA